MSTGASQEAHLRRLLEITRQMAAAIELPQLLRQIVDAACVVLECERATIFLYDRDRDELYSSVASGNAMIRMPADRGIAGAAARQRSVINVPDAYSDPRFNRQVDRETGFRTRNLLTFPLENLGGDLMGVLQALNKVDGAFTPEDEDLARVLSAQAGVALHRHTLLLEFAEKQRMARDLELAREIQQELFPEQAPAVAGYEIAGWNRCADETGGDMYDFLVLPEGRVAIFMADATGHGIGAALVIAQCRAMLRALLTVTGELVAVTDRVNQLLFEDLREDRFVTAFLGVLDTRAHRLDYVSAGQGPLLFLSGDQADYRTASCMPLAIAPDLQSEPESFAFAPGSLMVLLTDGFYEAADPAGEQFGEERVAEFVRRHARVPLADLVQRLHAEVERFTQGAPQADDLTAILVRRQP